MDFAVVPRRSGNNKFVADLALGEDVHGLRQVNVMLLRAVK